MKQPLYTIIGIGIFLFAWQMTSSLGIVDHFFLPSPLQTFSTLAKILVSGEIAADILSTIYKLLVSFIIALIIGIPLGLLIGSSKSIYNCIEFLIDFFRSIPATALFPLFLLFFGVNDESKIAVAAFTSTIIIMFNVAHGMKHVNISRVIAARLLGARGLKIFTTVYFWECLPSIFIGIRTAASLSLVVIIVTEMFVGSSAGIGQRIIDYQYIYNIPAMYAMIILAGIIGYLVNYIFIVAEKRTIHWSGYS
jgi:NitT/TauT family transport system permease protein